MNKITILTRSEMRWLSLHDILYQLPPRFLLNTCFSLISVITYFGKEEFLETRIRAMRIWVLISQMWFKYFYIINKLESFKSKSSIWFYRTEYIHIYQRSIFNWQCLLHLRDRSIVRAWVTIIRKPHQHLPLIILLVFLIQKPQPYQGSYMDGKLSCHVRCR